MGVVDDVRQVVQDMLALRLKSLDALMTGLETSMNQRFASAEAVSLARHEATAAQIAQLTSTTDAHIHALGARINQLAEMTDLRFNQLAGTVASNHAEILEKLDFHRRLERVEFMQSSYNQPRPKALGE